MLSKEIMGFMYEATDRDDISLPGLIENYLKHFEGTYMDPEVLIEVRDDILERIENAIKTLDERVS